MDDLKECREAFESEVHKRWESEINEPDLSRDSIGDYMDADMFSRFHWWQAAWNRRAVPQASAEQDALLERERRDAQSLASLLVKERRRFEFLHSTNCDAEGWEWGVARIRVNEYGECEYLWGVADHSDIDAAIAAAPQVSKGSEHPANNERQS